MGFVEALRELIEKFQMKGKTKTEIWNIVKTAADKATIKGENKAKGEFEKPILKIDSIDALTYAIRKAGITMQDVARATARMSKRNEHRQTNNWRKMHGMPMRRKVKEGRRDAGRKRTDCY